MKSTIINKIQRQGLRLSLCAAALTFATVASAQDDFDEQTTTVKTPKRKVAADKTPTVEIKGTVMDLATGTPVAGVRLQTLNDNRYTAMTDAQGNFTIKVPTYATSLYVSAPKYSSQQVAISGIGSKSLNISLLSDAFGEMYEDGTKKSAQQSYTSGGNVQNISEEIENKLGADVHAITRNGNNEQGAAMYIRGLNSINADAQPLIILDGVELDMQRSRTSLHQGDYFDVLSTISAEDIDKVTVLKNATALYGSRGANGVILIDTKRGHSMATRIDAKISAGFTFIPSKPTMMDASQYRNYAVEQLGTVPDLQTLQEKTSGIVNFQFLNDDKTGYYYNTYHNNTDWQDYVYRRAFTQNYSINVQGGDDVGMYNLSVAYTQTLKNVKETQFNRVNVRFNTDITLMSKLTTKFDMSFSRSNTDLFDDGVAENLDGGTITSPTFLSMIKSPLLSPYQYNHNTNGFTSLLSEADDLYSKLGTNYSLANPLAIIQNGHGDRKNRNENTFFNIAVMPTYEITDNLKLTTHLSYYLNRNSQAYYRPNIGVPSFYIEGLGTVYSMTASIFAKETNIISNTHLDWAKKFGAHDIAVTGGFRYNYFSYDGNDLESQYDNAGSDDKNPQLSVSERSTISGANDVWKNMQWYVSADYSYRNRYFAVVSLLAEANSRFGKNAANSVNAFGTHWMIYPSVQLGWVMTNESWFPKNIGINYLRINAGFDMSGNDDISNYAARTTFNTVRFNATNIGMQLTNVGNDQILPERTTKYNVGFEANFLNNRLGVRADFYLHKTTDLLALKSFDNPVGGINKYWTNDGSLENRGFEVSLNVKPIVEKNLSLELGASIGHYNNKVISLANGSYTTSAYGTDNILTAVGSPVGVFYGYQTADHVFATEEEASKAYNGVDYLKYKDETGADQTFNAGDVHFIDQNGDGYIDESDKVIIGDPNPDIYGNIYAKLTFKRFTLDLGFNYSLGNDVYNYQRSVLNSGSTLYNQQVAETNHWRYEGQITSLPRLAYGDPKGNNRFSDRWIEDGSYLRLKTVKLAYQIPIPESWQSWLQGISVWGEARNVFTLTRYTGSDPEFNVSSNLLYNGIDCGNIAMGRQVILGVKINL